MTKTNVKFIKEWSPSQFRAMNKQIAGHFRERVFLRHSTGNGEVNTRIYGSFSQIDNILGLAYTSTGTWACYGVCNVISHFDEDNIYSYQYFTIGEDGRFFAVLQDADENELTIEL